MIGNISGITLRGRLFTEGDLSTIKSCVTENFQLGRTMISRLICEELNWRQPNGWLKDRACRDVLRQLEEMKIISLPESLVKNRLTPEQSSKRDSKVLGKYDLTSEITSFPTTIDLIFAKGNKHEEIWNALVDKFHYLGHSVAVGRSIKYLIMSEDKLLGAISFSSPAWKLQTRDAILEKLNIKEPRNFVINNSRYLILPTVNVKNLASHLLSITTDRVVKDWTNYYLITPLVAETFVQPSLFDGTCYQAANWAYIGKTQGYAKRGSSYHNSQEPKHIYLYGLNRDIRRRLQDLVREEK